MITRKEAIKEFWMMYPNKFSYNKAERLLNKIFDSLEQHIKSLEAQLNTEQLTCDGCRHLINPEAYDEYAECPFNEDCIKWEANIKRDRFEPKDTQ